MAARGEVDPNDVIDSMLPGALTGAAFRRVLEQRLALAWEACRESGGALAVLMCDLDHFKRINDTWGHAVGDRALQAVARLLLAHCRERDLCARYGGEEFTLLLEETNGEEALEIADRLRRRVEGLEFETEGEPVPLSLSVGVAAFPELFAKTPEELLELADAALYEAKRQGRNRCFVVQGPGVFRDAQGRVVTTPGAEPPAARSDLHPIDAGDGACAGCLRRTASRGRGRFDRRRR